MMKQFVYIVFSSTPYRIGQAIRKITGEPYNHVSIALDPKPERMYSFARRYRSTPFYGGFVREHAGRYHMNGRAAQIKICRLPVKAEQYRQLELRLQRMEQEAEHYLYNHLSALAVLVKKPIPLRDAYTCVEFCVECLHELGVGVTPGQYYTVCDLERLLDKDVIYAGPFPQGQADTRFFTEKPLKHPTLSTLQSMAALLPRLKRNP